MNDLNDIVKGVIAGNNDDPNKLSNDLMKMTASIYEVGKRVTEYEIALAKKWSEVRSMYQSDKACDMSMKLTDEWKALKNAESAKTMLIELIRSSKKRLAYLQIEYENPIR